MAASKEYLRKLRKRYGLGEYSKGRKRSKSRKKKTKSYKKPKMGTDLKTFYKRNKSKRGFKVSTYKYVLNPYFMP